MLLLLIRLTMDHSVKAMDTSSRFTLCHIMNKHRFESHELESLYQRYIFKLQHSSVTSVVALFIILTAVLAAISFFFVDRLTAQNIYYSVHCFLFIVLLIFMHTKFMQDSHLIWVCYTILFFCLTYCLVSMPVGRYDMQEDAAAASSSSSSLTIESRQVAAEGVWQIFFVIFLAYAMMPINLIITVCFATFLPAMHVIISAIYAREFNDLYWEQVK